MGGCPEGASWDRPKRALAARKTSTSSNRFRWRSYRRDRNWPPETCASRIRYATAWCMSGPLGLDIWNRGGAELLRGLDQTGLLGMAWCFASDQAGALHSQSPIDAYKGRWWSHRGTIATSALSRFAHFKNNSQRINEFGHSRIQCGRCRRWLRLLVKDVISGVRWGFSRHRRRNSKRRVNKLSKLRRSNLRFAWSFPPGDERNGRRHVATSLRALLRDKNWLQAHVRNESWHTGLISSE